MSENRLLIDIEVFKFLQTLRRRDQENLLKRVRNIAGFPSNYSDFIEHDSAGRRVDVHIFEKFAIKFWNDSADRHLKFWTFIWRMVLLKMIETMNEIIAREEKKK
jgi:hypothetical protein